MLKEKGIDFQLIVFGDPDFSMPGIPIKALAWNEMDEVEVIGSFDIGLYPLPDEPWVYGKSGLSERICESFKMV
jgi:hypothetical protein